MNVNTIHCFDQLDKKEKNIGYVQLLGMLKFLKI
jgi:hypothetical protein